MLRLDRQRSIASPALAPAECDPEARSGAHIELTIGLVNNMPDSALKATERQFARLLKAAAPAHVRIRLQCFALPSVRRSRNAQAHIADSYRPIADLTGGFVDGLIVTGAEPIAEDLRDEAYWNDLITIVEWATTNTRSTIWSCLAAHAAVLHADGIVRRRLDAKCSGIYDCIKVAADPLTHNVRAALKVPHSRYNTLIEQDLVAHDYQILTRSDQAGVDIFARDMPSRFVFFQGHPEYDALSLQREYMRDMARYLSGERDEYPNIPASYFDAATEGVLRHFEVLAKDKRDPTLAAGLPGLTLRPDLAAGVASGLLFRNWIAWLARASAEA